MLKAGVFVRRHDRRNNLSLETTKNQMGTGVLSGALVLFCLVCLPAGVLGAPRSPEGQGTQGSLDKRASAAAGKKDSDEEIFDDLMGKASALVNKKKYREAIKLYDQITRLKVKTGQLGNALYKRGSAYQHLGAHEEALADLERAQSMGVRAKHINRYLGECYVHMAQFDKAIECINAAIKEQEEEEKEAPASRSRTPKSERLAGLFVHRSAAYKGKGDFARQLADLTSAIQVSQRSTRYYKERAVYYTAHGELAKAVQDYSKAIDSEPGNANTLNDRAYCLLKLKRYKEAADDWTRAIAVDPRKAGYYAARAQAYEGMGQKALANGDRKKVQDLGEDFEIEIWNKRPAEKKKKSPTPENP